MNKYYRDHKDRWLKYVGERRATLKAEGLCITCGKKPNDGTQRCSVCHSKRYHASITYKDRKKELHSQLKMRVFEAYGGPTCVCCNEYRLGFLTIDHINNDGAEHRRKLKNTWGSGMYTWLEKNQFPEGFRVLCYNCNCGRARNGGICPHEQERVATQ